MPSSAKLQDLINTVLGSISGALKSPVCVTEVELDLRSELIRTSEVNILFLIIVHTHYRYYQTAAANWVADVLKHAYDDALCTKVGRGSDGVFISAGTLRGDSVYPPGMPDIASN